MATSNLQVKRAEKNWSIAELSHFVLCEFQYFRQFAVEKKFPPSFQFPPNFFQEAFSSTVQWSERPCFKLCIYYELEVIKSISIIESVS